MELIALPIFRSNTKFIRHTWTVSLLLWFAAEKGDKEPKGGKDHKEDKKKDKDKDKDKRKFEKHYRICCCHVTFRSKIL